MEGKRVLITGGNSGIGIVTATALAQQGAEVVLACRDTAKTTAALKVINAGASTPAINLPVELDNLESVRKLAANFLGRYDRLDVLINNAGVFPPKQRTTVDGFEMQMGVNHLSHFLLTNLLLDCLKASSPARVVTVSSKLHKAGEIDFEVFKGYENYNSQSAYNSSKLANVLFGIELARQLEGTGVTSNVLHPGAVSTDIIRDLPWLLRKIIGMIFISPEKGALTNIMLASDPALVETNGKYYDQCELTDFSSQADDRVLCKKLWDVSAELTGLGG
ncbi:MAG: SDR family oxidoreductase [Gammaproteobacteria bacterium]|jgi:NAD(P)-dependent dehydrogenase (short-subunit alcohol dehydrogenase family)|nr:SDR family oxidoreductase [Gammaproteobacteria bacterium]MBT6583005.1 SDR family oxidoreductase [Gammaproteobacteria bacterium]